MHVLEQAPCVPVRARGDVRGEEGVPGDRVGAGDLVEHPARGGETGAGARGGVRGEKLVPGRGGGGAGLEKRGVGLGGGEGVVLAAAHAQLYRLRRRWRRRRACARARAFAEPAALALPVVFIAEPSDSMFLRFELLDEGVISCKCSRW